MKTFINLPVKDLAASKAFFTKLGFKFDQKFTNENAASMIISNESYVMLLQDNFFKTFTKKDISDATKTTEVIVSLSADSKETVNDLVKKALDAGASPSNEPVEDVGMYGWSFQDLDSHLWEIFYMDLTEVKHKVEIT